MRALAFFVLILLSGCAAAALEVDRAERERDYRALVASGLTPAQAAGALQSDSLAAAAPQTDAVVAYRERRRRMARADSLRALEDVSAADRDGSRSDDVPDMRRAEVERKAAWTPRATKNVAIIVGTAVVVVGACVVAALHSLDY